MRSSLFNIELECNFIEVFGEIISEIMDKAAKPQFSTEKFLSDWNGEFPQHTLKVADLKEPQLIMRALFQVFERLGIDFDYVVSPPPEDERDEHTQYYWDLIPVINMTRVVNHFISIMPQADIVLADIMYFLQPTVTSSNYILYLLFNVMIYTESQLRDIAPQEEEMFQKREQVYMLEQQKSKLQELLNEQAREKGKRSERLEELDRDIKQFEVELKEEKEAHDAEKQELDVVLKENQHLQVSVEQKKAHRDVLMAEVSRKRALRVYDADDIRAQAEQATLNVQEAEEKLDTLKQTLIQKETAIKNLQNIKPNLDAANNLLYEIAKLSETLKELECLENSPDEVDDELSMAEMELRDLSNQLAEVQQARRDNMKVCAVNRAKRQEQRAIALSALEEAEQTERRCREENEKAKLRIKSLQLATHKYDAEKQQGMKELKEFKEQIENELKTFSEALLAKADQVGKRIEDKLKGEMI